MLMHPCASDNVSGTARPADWTQSAETDNENLLLSV